MGKSNIRKTSGKYQTGEYFTQTQDKDDNDKVRQTEMGIPIYSTVGKNSTGQKHGLNWGQTAWISEFSYWY